MANQDKARLADYGAGWWYQGCVATAYVSYSIGLGSRRCERLTSGGLWGIESDSDKSYKASVEGEQLRDLAEHLQAFGIRASVADLTAKLEH